MTGNLILLLALLQDPTINARLDREEIYEGESALLSVSLENCREPRAPNMSALNQFDVRSAGERSLNSSSVTIINGQVTREESYGRTYSYLLAPKHSGTLIVPSITAQVDGVALKSKPLTLRVVAPERQDLVILDISSDLAAVYPLQPFSVTLRIYVKALPGRWQGRDPVSATQAPQLQIPWVEVSGDLKTESASDWLSSKVARRGKDGFKINEIASRDIFDMGDAMVFNLGGRVAKADDVAKVARLSGKAGEYWVYSLTRTFTPTRPGSYRFGPVQCKGTFGDEIVDNQIGGRKIYAIGPAAHVEVKSVPDLGRPLAFTGGVGEFSVDAKLAPSRAHVGEPVTLTLEVSGRGNLDDVGPPDLTQVEPIVKGFKIYEATAETKGSRRIFTYSLRPLSTKVNQIPGIPLAYFDVVHERYVTVTTEPIPFLVEEADRLKSEDIVSGAWRGVGRNSLEAHSEGVFANIVDPREVGDDSFRWGLASGYLGSLFTGYVLAVLGVRRHRRLKADPRLQRRRSAVTRARERIRQGNAENVRAALVGLVADASGIPEAGITRREISEKLTEVGLSSDLIVRTTGLLDTCDDRRYGGGKGAIEGADQVLESLIRALRKARVL